MSVAAQVPGVLVVSLDVDLCGPARAGEDEAIRRVLDLIDQRQLHATWALIGLDRAPARAAELIAMLSARPYQEIGTQSPAWYRGDDPAGRSLAQLDADLHAAKSIAERSGVQIRSLVFPRTQCSREARALLDRHGIRSYRSRRPGWAYAPSRSRLLGQLKHGLQLSDNFSLLIPDAAIPVARVSESERPLDIPACRFVRAYQPRLAKLESLRVHRMQSEMITAAESGWVYHLWLRPQEMADHLDENLIALDNLFRNARALASRVGLRIVTMHELAG